MKQLTEKAIIESFIKLLNEKPLDRITVKDIVEDCGINRNTFYYHFQGIPSLVVHILKEETEKVISKYGDISSWEDGFIAAAKFALNNKKAVYHIYYSVSREDLENYLNEIAKDVMSRFISKVSMDISVQKSDKDLLISFYKNALVGLTLDWISKGMKEDPEKAIRRLGTLLEGNVLASLKISRQDNL